MVANSEVIMKKKYHLNCIIQLYWTELNSFTILKHKVFEIHKAYQDNMCSNPWVCGK